MDDRLAALLTLADVVGDPTGDVDVAVVQQCAVADDNFVAIGMGDDALASDHVEVVRIGDRLAPRVRIVRLGDRRSTVRRGGRTLVGRVDDGVSEVVFALLLVGLGDEFPPLCCCPPQRQRPVESHQDPEPSVRHRR